MTVTLPQVYFLVRTPETSVLISGRRCFLSCGLAANEELWKNSSVWKHLCVQRHQPSDRCALELDARLWKTQWNPQVCKLARVATRLSTRGRCSAAGKVPHISVCLSLRPVSSSDHDFQAAEDGGLHAEQVGAQASWIPQEADGMAEGGEWISSQRLTWFRNVIKLASRFSSCLLCLCRANCGAESTSQKDLKTCQLLLWGCCRETTSARRSLQSEAQLRWISITNSYTVQFIRESIHEGLSNTAAYNWTYTLIWTC